MKYLLFIYLATLTDFVCIAREYNICVVDSLQNPIEDASVMYIANDSIEGIVYSDSRGMSTFSYDGSGRVGIEVQAMGYESRSLDINGVSDRYVIELRIAPEKIKLGELTVVADRSSTVKRLANGNRFYLSHNAREMNDPFMALKEIPGIISDPFNSTVTTLGGNTPLVLINGNELNSGIKPILPADIEYVEVIDAVPARYLAKGVSSIINIKLRKNRPPYVWTELATRNELPIHKGFGVWYFEVGNEKLSLYGRASAEYVHHSDTEGWSKQSNSGYEQSYDWTSQSDGHSYLGELLFKYVPSTRDYLALQMYEKYDKSNDGFSRSGEFTTSENEPYSMHSRGINRNSVFTSAAYYKHEFDSSTEFEVTVGYNNNSNKLQSGSVEQFGTSSYDAAYNYANRRNSGYISIDFSKMLSNSGYLQVGSYTTLLRDRIEMKMQPLFRHSNYDEYLYAGLSGSLSRLYYLLSAGMQARWLTAGEFSNNYVRPRATISGTWQFNSYNSVQLYYTTNNYAPDAGKLNPYNTSTDSLKITRGNPELVPQTTHSVKLTYTINKGGFYASAYGGANMFRDVIVPGGYTDAEGAYISTYVNQGHFRNLNTGIDLSYRFGNDALSGNVYGGIDYIRRYYTGWSPLGSFSYSAGFALWYRKIYFGSDISLNPRNYTDITTTKNLKPLYANLQINYNFTQNLYVAVCLQGFAGNNKTIVLTQDGTFRSETYTNSVETGLRPWILVRWNIRKNVKRKINLDKVLQNKESGIQLK